MRTILAALTAAALLLTLTGCNVTVSGFFDGCAVSEDRSVTVDADGARLLRADVDDGSLRVEGVADLKEVQVSATACARNQSDLSRLKLTADRTGDEVRVTTNTINNGYINLTLQVPASLSARIYDDSGDISVRQVGDVEIEDQSGSIELSDVRNVLIYDDSGEITIRNAGDVEIPDDSSGNIDVRGAGKVRIKDDSGEITLRNVGDVEIPDDGAGSIDVQGAGKVHITDDSGEIILRNVADVTIVSDESGGIDISGVQGNVVVDRDDSGDIRVDDVSGDFTVRADGSGSISHNRVGGHVQIPAKKH